MVEIRRILCPTDFSDNSRHALEHAIAVAGWYGADLIALHVGNPMVVLNTFIPIPPPALAGRTNWHRFEEELRMWLSPATTAGISTDVAVDEGNPVDRILDHAKSLEADLIVIGTHGQGGFQRFVLGSVAEKVLRKASCPVMTVPPRTASTSKLPFEQLLCPVDFSNSSNTALRFALSLAQETNARLSLLHVFEQWLDEETGIAVQTTEQRRQWEADARRQLAALIPDDVRNWCRPESKLAFGKAAELILAVAAAEQSDLIVMGVQGRSALDMMLFGSTTQEVVRRASCPVLTLRS